MIDPRINKTKFDSLLIRHKKMIAHVGYKLQNNPTCNIENDHQFIGMLETGRTLCLLNSDFKCSRCRTESNLTVHHFIERCAKEYLPFWQYVTQRHYWANQCVLCLDCHARYHGFSQHWITLTKNENGIIKINEVMKIAQNFLVKEKEVENAKE